MPLSDELISQYAKMATANNKPAKTEHTVMGTVTEYSGKFYVRIDGSDQLTPFDAATVSTKSGDRVTVVIKDHSATVTGNTSSPSTNQDDLDEAKTEIGNKITEVEILIADKVSTEQFDAEKGRIDDLVSDNVTIKERLTATEADIGVLEADSVTINQKLEANQAEIDNLDATKVSFEIADGKYATIENLETTNADIHNLQADYGEFERLATDKFAANDASIKNLETNKLSATDAELLYANIDFANITQAAVEKLFSDSGIIKDLVVDEGRITGELVGVTIKGDLIEGGTVIADKLVVKGSNGLYYKLNTDGVTAETEQTEYNSLNGSVITAKSITATKIAVEDLVAFGATIGGFNITDSAIYSGVKSSVGNTTRGIYLDKNGQIAFGDGSNYLKYFQDDDGIWKLAISAGSIKMSATGKDLETVVADAIVSTVEEFYQSTSPISLSGGSWSTSQPEWTEGTYIWRRTAVTYGDGSSEYTPNQNGVCITGNTGVSGEKGEDAVILQILSSNGNLFKNSTISTSLTVTIITSGEMITSSTEMKNKFGNAATIEWEQKRFGETEFVPLSKDDPRLSDDGFILTLQPQDVYTQTVFNCGLSY